MPVVLLVRHAQASAFGDDYDVLSEMGREQAKVVGAELARRELRRPVLVHGSLNRQRDTADTVAPFLPTLERRSEDPRWDEFDHVQLRARYSVDAGVEPDNRSIQAFLDHALGRWMADPDGGWDAFRRAGSDALAELVQTLDRQQDAVVVTSGGVISVIVAELIGAPMSSVVTLNRVTVNGGLTKAVVGPSGTSLLSFNDHAHFEAEQRSLLTYR